jgi:hypothetical protein
MRTLKTRSIIHVVRGVSVAVSSVAGVGGFWKVIFMLVKCVSSTVR